MLFVTVTLILKLLGTKLFIMQQWSQEVFFLPPISLQILLASTTASNVSPVLYHM